MDPKACLSDILDALHDGEDDIAKERAEDLLSWLKRGGFVPGDLRKSSVIYFCHYVMHLN